ncbi:MAG: dihydroorotate dehydrogenase electron transfer subunit [Eubacteriales bacterium]|nr:dihydroorotate dehydrogenase electron transfer subunit [Eubacteriales bacterium]
MKQSIFKILTNEPIAKEVYKMTLQGDCSDITKSGQFVNIKLEGFYLRRPISVCEVEGDILTIIYKVVGKGTDAMSKMGKDTELDILTGLGNGYTLDQSGEKPLLVGGGVGVPPMYELAKRLVKDGKQVSVIIGFNKAEEIFYEAEFRALGCEVYVATADGSVGTKGFVTHVMKNLEDYTYVYACGPEPMLKAVWSEAKTSGQFSFEERMGCGFGACMGCSCKTKYGNKRICKEGPILVKEEIIW